MASFDRGKGKAKDTDSNLESQPKENTTREVPTLDMTRTLATIQAGDKRTSDQRSPQTPVAPPPEKKRGRYDPVREDRFQEPRTGRYDPVREGRSYDQQRIYEERNQTETPYDPILGRPIPSGRPADHLRTTPAAPSSDAPTTPARPPQFEQGSSSSSSEQSWRHPNELKKSLATKGKWDNKLAQKIKEAGGLTKNEIKALRDHLRDQYPGATLYLGSSNYNDECKKHYNQIDTLEEKHIASRKTKTYKQNTKDSDNDRYRGFGEQGINKGLHSWHLPPSAK
jgi:hypothetical protein